ncbi:MAG: FlgD immunoglobulin-like domain containing protein [Candidatus Latescibacterota bacterium]
MLVLLWLAPRAFGALPVFENRTPVGFSPADSTVQEDFVLGQEVTVRVDLNQAATPTYPVIGHFHRLERSRQVESRDVDGLRADIAVSAQGAIHMAWISQEVVLPVSTPVYHVRHARSEDGGQTFSSPASVSGSLRFDPLTLAANGPSFSTVDLELDSRGNPRVVYAFDFSADGGLARFSNHPDNVYLNYSENGGASWLPGNGAILVNDTLTVGNTEGRRAAFPRLVIDQRDNLFVTYVRGASRTGTGDDVMLARANRQSTPYTMETVGALGTAGSTGGVRLTADGVRQTGPDIGVGTGDVLHVLYFNDGADRIEHKTLLADSWSTVGPLGWDQDAAGAVVDDFDNEATNPALETGALFYFPTLAVDRVSSPNRVYALYKFGDATYETVFYNRYVYDHAVGGGAGWVAAQAAPVWSTATSPLFADGAGKYNIELDWTVTETVAAVVDDRRADQGELHIAFSAGYSGGGEHDLYYGFYNGSSWTLPEKVADDNAGAASGIDAADTYLTAPALAKASGSTSLCLAFAGGSGEGLGVDNVTNVDQHAYFKVLGRDLAWEDQSVPVGGFQYDLSYTPVNAQSWSAEITNNLIPVHVADNADGAGLGARGYPAADGFLAGEWESIGTRLTDNDKFFEGRYNEDASSTHEWGDDDDKVGLLVKLNVLGSDSPTNVQAVTSSTASAGGTGVGARSVRVAANPAGSFVAAGSFFLLGADIDIVDANTAPVVVLRQPDGVGDEASLSYAIDYDLTDVDDDISTGALDVGLYFAPDSTLTSVQDIRIFGRLIADQNDDPAVFASGTGDLAEGVHQTYTWDDPPEALKAKLFASIQKVLSGRYFVYLVADDGKNPPVFACSPGALTIRHRPIVDFVAPAGLDTVDTGVRSGEHANPYDLDFAVRDFDRQGSTQVQLFYAAASGLSSVSVIGTYPSLRFTLGKSLAGVRGVPLTHADTLTSADSEFSWDLTDSVAVRVGAAVDSQIVAEGAYYLYVVASDSQNVTVGQSRATLVVKHSPSFTFYEPAVDTHRRLSTGSQPVYTIQWQKGRGAADFDDDATVDFYFTTDNPATVNYEDWPDSLLRDADTRLLATGLGEDGEGADDFYEWDLRDPPYDVPPDGTPVWLYAVTTDAHGNRSVALGGALTMTHEPRIVLLSSKLDEYGAFQKNDVLRIAWDDHLVDDGVSTDDAYIRVYASTNNGLASLAALDGAVNGTTTVLVNSSNGALTGTIRAIREDSLDFLDWDTRLSGTASTAYWIYAAIAKDPTFANNTATTFDRSTSALSIGAAGALPNIATSPTDQVVAVGDTVTLDVVVQHSSPANLVQVVLRLGDNSFTVVDQSSQAGPQPFVDLGEVFPGTTPIENTFKSGANQLRFAKSTFMGQVVGTPTQPARLARFQLVPTSQLQASPSVVFSGGETGTVLGVVGKSDPLDDGEGLGLADPDLERVIRGTIQATVQLEGHTAPLGTGNHATLLDVHLRRPGSLVDITDATFRSANDDYATTTDTVEVQTSAAGALTLYSVPPGRYVLTVKDTSHISGRTDTIVVRNGETVTILSASNNGFFGSDLRGDPTSLLPSSGRQLPAGDVSGDNEINEDDINLIVAAWGTDDTKPSFRQADINNDDAVGAPDLTVTTSNFGNSEGFGAPPVFRPVVTGPVELLLEPEGRVGEDGLAEVALRARGLQDLAGYEVSLGYDPGALAPEAEGVQPGDVFAGNPQGAVFGSSAPAGELRLLGARIGKEWSAGGEGVLARLRFRLLHPDGLASLVPAQAVLLTSRYASAPVRWQSAVQTAFLPARPALEPNFPNPFNPGTNLRFAVPAPGPVQLAVYDVLGQKVRTLVRGPVAAGRHARVWDGRDESGHAVASGVYIALLEAGGVRQTRRLTLIR